MAHTSRSVHAVVVFTCLAAAWGCGSSGHASGTAHDAASGTAHDAASGTAHDAAAGGSCVACTKAADCSGGTTCAMLTGESFCLTPCSDAGTCGAGASCLTESDPSGKAARVCVPQRECGLLPATADAGLPVPVDAGGAATGNVGLDGGTASRLLFAAVGDTRGELPLDSSYPTSIITQIFATIQAFNPRPLFVVSTGDYAFELLTDTSTQLGYYLTARKQFTGPFFPVLGNHECFTTVSSNCGSGNANGNTPQYSAFLSTMLAPVGRTIPYYSFRVDAEDGSWTSKFVVIAANAWTDAQGTWLDGALSVPTTYTFILRHEDVTATTAPGVTPSATIFAKHPYTLLIVGHIHTYSHSGQQVLFGNGGAPLNAAVDYGFGLFSQRSDGAIQVDAIDYKTGLADSSFSFAVHADGTPAP